MIADDHRLRTYADCGMKAFGPRSAALASVSFFVDLFTVRYTYILSITYIDQNLIKGGSPLQVSFS